MKLYGHAKKLVPFSLTNNIDDAWEALNKAYGDPARLMQHRKASLIKLGSLPKETDEGRRSQIEWYLELEAILRSIIDLGIKTNAMYGEAFSATTFRTIQKMFPSNLMRKLMKCSGDFGPDLMEQFLSTISDLRSEAQGILLIEETPSYVGSSHLTAPNTGGGGGVFGGGGGRVGQREGYDCSLDEDSAVSSSDEGSTEDDTDEDYLSNDSDEEHREEPGGDPPDA